VFSPGGCLGGLRVTFLKVTVIYGRTYPSSSEEERLNYTRFEKARIIGARALQLSMGAPCLLANLPKDVIDPVDIAMLEFNEDAIPITVKRKER
jgi:DNA-directed RNA polymerase subunit K